MKIITEYLVEASDVLMHLRNWGYLNDFLSTLSIENLLDLRQTINCFAKKSSRVEDMVKVIFRQYWVEERYWAMDRDWQRICKEKGITGWSD